MNGCVRYELYSSIYQDFISNVKTVKALNNSNYFYNKIKKYGKNCNQKSKKYIHLYAKETIVRNISILLIFSIALIKALYDLSQGMDTLGIITFYMTLFMEMDFIFSSLSKNIISWFQLKTIHKTIKKIFEKLDKRIILLEFKEILFQDVKIHYPESNYDIEVPFLNIKKQEHICIMGKSGQGKTTILNMILGNINHYKGTILMNEESLETSRFDIGVVSQEIELFNMSIRDNLCFDHKKTDEELKLDLHELELDDFNFFQNGLDTIIGEKGLKLSTGQKRRFNLYRSYYMNKDIYIFDEPTSNLDAETEKIVCDFIKHHFQDKTLIISTHNEEIKKICHKFYVVKDHCLQLEKF